MLFRSGIAPDGKKAVLNAALFAFNRRRVEGVLQRAGLSLADGVKVRVRGTPDYYGQYGKLSIKVTDIDPRFTLGDLVMAREELVRSLRERGLYDLNRQLEVPAVPLRASRSARSPTTPANWNPTARAARSRKALH